MTPTETRHFRILASYSSAIDWLSAAKLGRRLEKDRQEIKGRLRKEEREGHTESPDIRPFNTPSLSSGTTDSTFGGNLGTGSARSTSSLNEASCKAALLLSNLLCSNNDGSSAGSVLPLFLPIHHSPPILRSLSYE
jgi:hypothetical protein